ILLDDRAWSADAERRALARAGLAQVSSRALARDLSASSPLTLRWAGYLIVGDELRPLPIGSTLDSDAGVFSWLPGPGFLGDYRLVFIDHENKSKAFLTIRIEGSGLNFGRF
ncbi:MAG: hypothetical protein NTZ26_09035, partial [Candidatus Aminicenantes bacterium]|nr:hypothetical protein [Candidatus Aminicenantes bacterium]